MKDEIVFNCLFDESQTLKSITMSSVKHQTLHKIKSFPYTTTSSEYWPAIQVFNAPMRISSLSEQPELWQSWNGCCFVDVDFKQLSKEQMENYQISEIQHAISCHLQYDMNLYAYQISKSGKGLHYIFFYDIERSAENFRRCARISQDRIKAAIKNSSLTLYQIIEEHDGKFPRQKVIDDCSLNASQLLIMSSYSLYAGNHKSNSEFGKIDLQSMKASDEEMTTTELRYEYSNGIATNSTKWNFDKVEWDGSYGNIAWNEVGSWQMPTFLCLIGMAYETAVNIWYEMFQNGWNGRKSSWPQIHNEFNQAWNRAGKYQICKVQKCYVDFAREHLGVYQYHHLSDDPDQQRLDDFLNDHKPHSCPYMPFEPNYTFSLNENQYISDIEDNIDLLMKEAHASQSYIKAGCGAGKTKQIIRKFKKSPKAIILCHLNSIRNSNYDEFLQKDGVKYEKPTCAKLKNILKKGHDLPDHLLLGWNQFSDLLSNVDNLNDYDVYIDEAHAFQSEYCYRHKVIISIISNISKVPNLHLYSATPGAEHDVLLTDPSALRIEVNKQAPFDVEYYSILNSNDKKQGNIVEAIAEFVRRCYWSNPNSNFAILDNRSHAKYDRFFDDLSYLRLCRNKSETADVQDILSSQKLNKRILVSTNFGKEGIEFFDEIDELVVIVPRYSDIRNHDIEQFINRFRNKKHVSLFLFEINPWKNQTDQELLRKTCNLISKESMMDERFPKILSENNGSIMKATGIDLTEFLGTDRLFTVAKLVSYYINDLLMNNIWNQNNLRRLFPNIKTISQSYTIAKEKSTDHVKEKKLLSERTVLTRYLNAGRNIESIIRMMQHDEIIQQEQDVNEMVDLFYTVNLFIGKEENLSSDDLSWKQWLSVDYIRRELDRVRDITTLIGYDKDSAYLTDKSWAFLCLWRNNKGIVNFQKALKFAVLGSKNDRCASISARQRIERQREVQWMTKEVEKLEYRGQTIQFDSKKGLSVSWEWLDWREVRQKKSKSTVERSKGGRMHEKYCTTDGLVKFSRRDEMYQYVKEHYGYNRTFKQFKKDWSNLCYFRKLES